MDPQTAANNLVIAWSQESEEDKAMTAKATLDAVAALLACAGVQPGMARHPAAPKK